MKKRYQENRHIIDAFKYPTGVSTRVIYSTSREPNITLERLDVTLRPKKTWNHYKIVNRYGPGDGVVCLDSLLVPYVWDCDNVFYHHLPNTEHSNVFS